jgi:hypothetical protein
MDLFPEWLRTPLIAAVIAALGYVAKLAIEELSRWRSIRRERRANLVALQSLLLASKRVFEIQNDLVRRLCSEIEATHPDLTGPYDEVLASAYTRMDERQKLIHGLIRAYTINAMRPLNLAMIDWLARDTHFKGHAATGSADDLASNLQTLEAHLLLWRAKYEFWIPDKPARAIVYMLDESEHGVGFPTGIEQLIERVTGGPIRRSRA